MSSGQPATAPVRMMMEYSGELTRAFYRSVALEDNDALGKLRALIADSGGKIGNADFVDVEIREGLRLLVTPNKLNTPPHCLTNPADQLNRHYAWDQFGVWMPRVDE